MGACLLMWRLMLGSQEAVRLLGKADPTEMVEPKMSMTNGLTAGLPLRGIKDSACRFSMDRGRDDPGEATLRSSTMNTAKERSTLATLQAQRQSLRRELAI